jgi:3-hydroxybutyryl-CoA dehydrogenase
VESSRICVVGTGYVGRQLCLACALGGFEVWGNDTSSEALAEARQFAYQYLAERVAKGKLGLEAADAARQRLHYTTSIEEAVRLSGFVIETIVEQLQAKRTLFAELDRIAGPNCVLSSNSSFIPSSLMAEVTSRPERVCNLHFFNPILVMKLAEVVKGRHTSDWTVQQATDLALALGKTPVLLKKECHGFIVNRVMMTMIREVLAIVNEGVASPHDVDIAIEAGLNHPMGPFRLMDLIGVDLVYEALADLDEQAEHAGAVKTDSAIPGLIREMYQSGKLGRRTGSGFYDY